MTSSLVATEYRDWNQFSLQILAGCLNSLLVQAPRKIPSHHQAFREMECSWSPSDGTEVVARLLGSRSNLTLSRFSDCASKTVLLEMLGSGFSVKIVLSILDNIGILSGSLCCSPSEPELLDLGSLWLLRCRSGHFPKDSVSLLSRVATWFS